MFRHAWYQSLFEKMPDIQREAAASAERLGLDRYKDRISTYQGSSGCPARLPDYVLDANVAANQTDILPARRIADEMRDLVKQVYGDDYDVCVTNTAEAALRVSFETLSAPPSMRKGDQYRGRVLQVFGEDAEWGGGYGRAFPPKYKNWAMDRTVSGGELGIPLYNLEDLYCGTNAIDAAVMAMGQAGSTIYGGNVLIGPGLGLLDAHGDLIQDAARAAMKGLVEAFAITCRHAGLGD